MAINTTVLKSEFDKLVQLEIEKINISESIKLIKQSLKEEGLESSEVSALCKIAAAKAKEALEDLDTSARKVQEFLEIVT